MSFSTEFRLRFFWKLDVPSLDDCWEWGRGRDHFGYGCVHVPGRGNDRVHRVSYEMANGPIPKGLVVRHRCDNPPCGNPAHLELGTLADNNRDAMNRGRTKKPKPYCRYGHDQSVHRYSKGCRRCNQYMSRELYRQRHWPGYTSPPRETWTPDSP